MFELLKKQAAESKRNGVVGRSGTTIPINPRIKDNEPAIISKNFLKSEIIYSNKEKYLLKNLQISIKFRKFVFLLEAKRIR